MIAAVIALSSTTLVLLAALVYGRSAPLDLLRDLQRTMTEERAEHRKEIRALLVHIQAPARAVAVFEATQDTDMPDGRPLSDEEAAERDQKVADAERSAALIAEWEAQANNFAGLPA